MVTSVSFSNNPYYVQDYQNLNTSQNVVTAPVASAPETDISDINTKKSKEYTCTDGCDDGKLSWKEAGKCILDGVVKNIKDRIADAKGGIIKKFKEDPVKTSLVTAGVAIGTIAIMASPLAPAAIAVLGVLGLAFSLKQGVEALKGVAEAAKDAKNATTDKEAKEAFCNIGDNGVDLVESAVEIYASTRALSSTINALDDAAEATKHMDDIKKITDGSANLEDVQKLSEEAKDIKDGLENVFENREVLQDGFKDGLQKGTITDKLFTSLFGISLPIYNEVSKYMKKEEV